MCRQSTVLHAAAPGAWQTLSYGVGTSLNIHVRRHGKGMPFQRDRFRKFVQESFPLDPDPFSLHREAAYRGWSRSRGTSPLELLCVATTIGPKHIQNRLSKPCKDRLATCCLRRCLRVFLPLLDAVIVQACIHNATAASITESMVALMHGFERGHRCRILTDLA